MRILNPLAYILFVLTRVCISVSWGFYRLVGGLLKVLWIPLKGVLYVVGAAVGLGLVVGLALLVWHGGHFHSDNNAGQVPVRVYGK